MRSIVRALGALCALSVVGAAPAFAAGTQDPDRLAISVGQFDTSLFGKNSQPGIMRESVDLRLDYRFGNSLIPYFDDYVKIKPWIGIQTNNDGFFWGGAGIVFDAPIGKYFYISPSFGPGIYSRGSSKKMGAMIEFRTTFEAGIRFSGDTRLGVYVSHISNAKLTTHNPGENTIGATLSIPVGNIFPSN